MRRRYWLYAAVLAFAAGLWSPPLGSTLLTALIGLYGLRWMVRFWRWVYHHLGGWVNA